MFVSWPNIRKGNPKFNNNINSVYCSGCIWCDFGMTLELCALCGGNFTSCYRSEKHWGEAKCLSGKLLQTKPGLWQFQFFSFFSPLNWNTVVRVTRSVKSKGSFRCQTKTRNHEMHLHAVQYTDIPDPFFFFFLIFMLLLMCIPDLV